MKRKNFLIFFLIFLIGIFVGFLFSNYIIPEVGSLLISKKGIDFPVEISSSEKETQLLCQKVKQGIEVDLTGQKLRMCEQGKFIAQFSVSTGKQETPTPVGEFAVIKKSSMLYSKLAESWLPFWIGFQGDYGFHELPINEAGKRIGEDKIGTPDSLGCVRLKVGDAERVYNWAEIGTKIVIY